ncbi:hypothetical protein AB1388_11685 [Streptomyces hydrogenans]|uniref:hypothetical protein n=1 Tax=Streptomyces hydrogenans TaxID=1873719 RepID=UPI00345CE32F
MSTTITTTYGTPHNVSETNPTHVTSCDRYRLSLVGTIAPGTPGYEDMVEMLRENGHDTRPEGYGLIFLESEELSAIYFGSTEQIEQCKRDNASGTATFDASQGMTYAKWPHGKGWDDYIPRTFWNVQARGGIADGVGLVTAFAHTEVRGAEVIVYEFEGTWSRGGEPQQMVTYHCTACHLDTFHSGGDVHENTGPSSRRWAARQARQHIVSAHRNGVGTTNSACRPNNGEILRAVNAVAREMWGAQSNALPDTDDAYCATKGPCSLIRELRAGIRPPGYRA